MNINYEINGNSLQFIPTPDSTKEDFDGIVKQITSDIKTVKVDMKEFTYINSIQLSNLILVKKTASAVSATVILMNTQKDVYQVMEMSNLLKLFVFEKNFGTYTITDLLNMFHDDEVNDDVSLFIAENFDNYATAMMDAINNPDAIIAEYAILTIGRAQGTAGISAVRNALKSDYPNVVRAAIQALGWLWDEDSKEEFYKLIESDNEEIALAAGASIAMVCNESDPARLGKIAQNKAPHVRVAVAGTLALINGERAFEIVKEMLKSETVEDVRKILVKKVSFFNKPEATEILVSLLDDKNKFIQEAAAAGLQRTGLRGHDDIVLKKVLSSDIWISYFAVKALGTNCIESSAKTLMELYEKVGDNVKLAIIETISTSTSATDSSAFLAKNITSDNEDIRKESLTALYKVSKKSALEQSLVLLEKDTSWLVRYKALEIIIELKPEGYRTLLGKHKDSNQYIMNKIAAELGE